MKREDVLRLKKAIESDRMSMTAAGLDVIIDDLKSVLSDYFFFSASPTLDIKVQGGKYVVEIKVIADALRTFAKIG
ncbi:MAG: hypothetical protein IKA61_03005 [Clostridia bacterium]|nr:hypothetical protein [Clostridia bacterium]